MPSLAEIVEIFDTLYDPKRAAEWDAVGLVVGHPGRQVDRVLFAIDPVQAVVDEALAWKADLIVTHHPLFLRPVHSVAATTPKGKVVHALLTNGIALHVCHTNADVANPGVSDALAAAIGLTGELRPIEPEPDHPERGIGRIGKLPDGPETLREFARRVGSALPFTGHGVRVAGDVDRLVESVAVSGGSGDAYLSAVRQKAVDVYVTADLRHHPASEFGEFPDAPALVDVAHWASEWPWLAQAAAELTRAVAGQGATLETRVSTICTDPWAHPRGGKP